MGSRLPAGSNGVRLLFERGSTCDGVRNEGEKGVVGWEE